MIERFENRLNKENIKFRTQNPVWDNEIEDALNVFEMITEMNKLHNNYTKLKEAYDVVVAHLDEKTYIEIEELLI